MGSAKYLEKYRAKYGREPTAEELAAFTKKYKAKKEARKSEDKAGAAAAAPPPPEASSSKKAGKKASGPVTPSASAGASGSIAVGQSSKATGKRKRSEAEASEMQRAKVLGKVAGLAIAASQSGVLAIAAAKKSKAHHLSEDAFKVAWTDHAAGAEALLATFEEGIEHLPEEQRKALLAPYRERLALSLTPADDVIERCRSKQAAKDAAKAAKRPPKTPKPPKEQVVDPAIRDAGLAVLAKHKYDVLNACMGAAKSGYLSTDQLKHICIHKGVFSPGINRMEMINKLVKGQCFAAEAAGGAGEDEASSTDSES